MYEKRNDYDETLETLDSIKSKLPSFPEIIAKKKTFLGFDGYVDSLYTMVATRKSVSEWIKMESMKTYGKQVIEAAGSSTSVERVLKSRTYGGFAPNTCGAMNALGIRICLMGACGYPQLHGVFSPLASKKTIDIHSFTNPGDTIALEFDDGKIMMQDFGNILKINWDLIKARISLESLIQNLNNANVMGFGHWSLIPELTNTWIKLHEEIFPSLSNLKEKLFFADLADIKKRTKEDILEMLNVLKKINEEVPVLLSLNDQECLDIYKSLYNVECINRDQMDRNEFIEKTRLINEKLNISYLVTHSPHFAIMVSQNHIKWVTEGFTSHPKFMTGAGDHFNSGLVAGLACDLSGPESLLFGNALTAIFVRTGISPDFMQLSKFINNYLDYVEEDNPNFP